MHNILNSSRFFYLVMSEKINVLCIWKPNERLLKYLQVGLKEYPEVNLVIPSDLSQEVLVELAPSADIIMGWRPTIELLNAATNLKLFINPGAGVQHLIPIFKEATIDREIVLVNGHGNSYFTAQHALALLLAIMNKVVVHHNWMEDGQWRKRDEDAISIPLRGRKVGLLGYGAVNQKVHQFMSGFNVEFSILRRNWKKQTPQLPTTAEKYSEENLKDFLKEIDTLVIAVPLTSNTKGMIKEEELLLLGEDGLIVNIGRGEVVDEESLYNVLKNNKIMGAAIDVWYNYQPEEDELGRKFPFNYPFNELDNVILSPHRGASPMNDLKRWDEQIENISKFARGEKDFLNIVNLDEGY
jgi:D-3-phosphoglycerate dehydrogenase